MADYGRGAKAGAMAGVVLGVILAAGYYVLFTLISDTIRTAIQNNLPAGSVATADQVLAIALAFLVIAVLIGSIISGVNLGIIFAAVSDKYMRGQSFAMRGLVFGVIIWLIGILFNVGNFYYGATYVAISIVLGLVASLVYGYLLGTFYGRSAPKQATPPSATM